MKNYKRYGSDPTSLFLSDKAQSAYNGCDYHIRQYGDRYEIWLDNHREVGPMTADEINAYFEEWADENNRYSEEWGGEDSASAEGDAPAFIRADVSLAAQLRDVYARLTPDELAILASIPVYSKDVRAAAAIRGKYSLSWNELRALRDMAQ